MNPRLMAFIMTVVMALSPLVASGIANTGCWDHVCNCHVPDMIGHEVDSMMVLSLKDCCCRTAGNTPCSLTTSAPSPNFGWALSPKRIEAPSFHVCGVFEIVDLFGILDKYYSPDVEGHRLPAGTPPIYLSVMSFLC